HVLAAGSSYRTLRQRSRSPGALIEKESALVHLADSLDGWPGGGSGGYRATASSGWCTTSYRLMTRAWFTVQTGETKGSTMGNRPDETQSIEYEAKVLNVDPDNIDRRVLSQGGVKVADRLMRRYVYDIEPGDMSRWIRLRDTGTSVTLATKRIRHDGIDGTDEVEVGVDSFEKTHALLGAMGFVAKAYQENRRVSYRLNDCDVELDSWPLIPVYVEIEGRSRDHVIEVARLLGFTETDLTGENTTKIYSRYGIDLSSISDLRL
ncbi:MAG TPA: hypothetical protein VFE39_07890, partial [Pseudonocardia sp.]|nr:hypothetical protein [Pseudonocardia sp.]